ncbi:hypothetical protein OE749_13755 [Aestuariibacter sp. AA17]|uniref:Uncharacterized protein n=1 Tax=Fluctibacter corallii TaxID=2984329 RepID=A0ABT3AAR1_9ALTE|nr:hypothetical protein [Aestuariibacter sp. AA17]MCV2885758.1 hypothetical protein [Aestuariibacter sp. AA17]
MNVETKASHSPGCQSQINDDYETGGIDKIEHDRLVKEARDRLYQILREIQKH